MDAIRTYVYLSYVRQPTTTGRFWACEQKKRGGEWNISHRDFRSLKRRIAHGVSEKRNFSCRITPRRKEEKEATYRNKSGDGKERVMKKEGEKREKRERERKMARKTYFTRKSGSRVAINIDILLLASLIERSGRKNIDWTSKRIVVYNSATFRADIPSADLSGLFVV